MINSYWSLLKRGNKWFLIQGVKLEHILEFGKISRLNLMPKVGLGARQFCDFDLSYHSSGGSRIHMDSRCVFILKFGKKIANVHRMEIRNHSLELLGITFADNWEEISQLVALPELGPRFKEELQAIPHGKITPIAI